MDEQDEGDRYPVHPVHPCKVQVLPGELTCLRCGETITAALFDKNDHANLFCIRCTDEDGPPAPLVPSVAYLRPEEIQRHAYA